LAAQDWPKFHNDLALTGYTTSEAPDMANLLWVFDTGFDVRASPVIANGVLYIGNLAGVFYAVDAATGDAVWSYPTLGSVYSTAAVLNGKVYFAVDHGGVEDSLFCLDAATGDWLWSASILNGPYGWSSPAVVAGTPPLVFVGSGAGSVMRFNGDTGAGMGTAPVGGTPNSPITYANDKIYTGTHNFTNADPTLVALNAGSGSVAWTYDYYLYHGGVVGFVNANGAAVADGDSDADLDVYFGVVTWTGNGPEAICLDEATGAEVWTKDIGGWSTSTPAVHGGRVFIGSDDGRLYALDAATGVADWYFQTGGPVWSAPAVADGKVFIGSLDHTLYAVDEGDGSILWSYYTGASRMYSSPAVADGNVFIGNENGKVYAFASIAYVDIKPTSCPNPLNTKSNGKLPVAVLGSDLLDVTEIDPATVRLEGVSPLRWSYEDVSTPLIGGGECECTTAGPDGLMDLVLHFDTQAIVAALGPVIDGEFRELTLTLTTFAGAELSGTDCVWIKHKVKDGAPPRFFTRSFDGGATTVYLGLSEATDLEVTVYDIRGRKVTTLTNGNLPEGDHAIRWSGADDAGHTVANGVYFCNLRAGSIDQTVKMILAR